MLGRNRHSKCGWPRCRFCQRGDEVRRFKRLEQRQVAAEAAAVLSRPAANPFADLSDCLHGCSGSPSCCERCTFTCHNESFAVPSPDAGVPFPLVHD
jgi:hypothetical protein